MAWDDGLTGVALNIAATHKTPLRVNAGPGTGKSYALKRRVARHLEEGADPKRILAVTFTRNAAQNLVDDLHSLGVEGCENIQARTLHSWCFELLNKEEVFGYLGRVPRPLVTFNKAKSFQFEAAPMLSDLIFSDHSFGPRKKCTERIRAFEASWARLQSEEPGWSSDAVDQKLEQELVSWLRFHKAILIGELVPEALRFLRNNPASGARAAFSHVLVDEYQDLNKSEQTLVDLIADAGSTSIVGDVDQSIYSFRYANPEGISEFKTRHPMTHDESLAECRRCPQRVVVLANSLISHNHPGQTPSRLLAKEDNPEGYVHIVQWRDIEEEAKGVSDFVRFLVNHRGYEPGEVLIIVPRRLMGYRIRDRLREIGVPSHSFFSEEALEAKTAQQSFALLTLLRNPDDRVALRWWLGKDSQNHLSGQYAKLRAHCESTGISPRTALDDVVNGTLKISGIARLVDKYRELQLSLANIQELDPASLIDIVAPEGNDDLGALRDIALNALSTVETVCQLYDEIKTHITQPEIPNESEFVRIMSPHKSKGLTSKATIMVGCVEGLFPVHDDDASPTEQQLIKDEQRRLFYVGITRCTETLVVSSALRMDRQMAYRTGAKFYGSGTGLVNVQASYFIDELGPDAPNPVTGEDWANGNYGF